MELLYAHLLSRNHSLYLNSLLAVRTCECNRIVLNGVSHVEKAPVSKELLIQSENVVLLCLCIPVLCITLIIIYAITLYIYGDIHHMDMNIRWVFSLIHGPG